MKLNEVECKHRAKCAICSNNLDTIIELSNYPLTETYVKEKTDADGWLLNQKFLYCTNCGHGQLETIIPQDILYGDDYTFRTSKSGSKSNNNVLLEFINETTDKRHFKKIIEIGCNDAYLLNLLKDRSDKLIGIDPVLESDSNDEKVELISDFFENVDLDVKESLVITNQVIEHLEEPRHFFEKLLEGSDDKTIFIFAFPGLDHLVNDMRFDQIYHHHLHYFSMHSILYLLNELGCECINSMINPHYWGSIFVAFKKSDKKNKLPPKIEKQHIMDQYDIFKEKMVMTNQYIEAFKDKMIYGYGAGLQVPVLNYYIPNISKYIKCILDDDINKDGLYFPGMTPRITYNNMDLKDKYILITGVNYSRAILKNIIIQNPERVCIPFNII